MEFSIRTAVPAELVGLLDIQRRASLVWEEYREQLEANPDAIDLPADALAGGCVRVAVAGGRLVGFATVLVPEAGVGELDGLFVEPDAMAAGVGRELIADAVVRAHQQGLSHIAVTANPRALGFYDKVGFVTTGSVATRFGPGVRMVLTC